MTNDDSVENTESDLEQLQILRDLLDEQARLKRRVAWTIRALRATDELSWRTIAKGVGLSVDQVRWMSQENKPSGATEPVVLTTPKEPPHQWVEQRGVTPAAAARLLGISRPAVYARVDAGRYTSIPRDDGRQLVAVDAEGNVIDNFGLKPGDRTR